MFAKNPKTGIAGPVCHNNWTLENVRLDANHFYSLSNKGLSYIDRVRLNHQT